MRYAARQNAGRRPETQITDFYYGRYIMKAKNVLTKPFVVAALATLCCILWGSATPAIKTAYKVFQIGSDDIMSRLVLAGVRFFFAGVIIILYGSVSAKRFIRPEKGNVSRIIGLGMVQTVLQYFFFYMGLAHTTGIKSAIVGASATFFSILLSVLCRMERLTLRKAAGCVIGFCGVVIINLSGGSFGRLNLSGDGAILLSTVLNAVASIMIKKFSAKEDPVVLTGYQFLFGGAVLAAAGFLGHGKLLPVAPSAWLLMAYMSLLSAVAYTLWSVLLKENPVSRVSVYYFANPVFGVILSAMILREQNAFTPLVCAVSLALVCAGILIVNLRPGKE